MTIHPILPTALAQFADVLDYPQPGLANTSRLCAKTVARLSLLPPAAESRHLPPEALLHAFASEVEPMSYGLQEEAYASTFDLGGAYPYVGYQLLGETYKRSVFMLELKNRYRAHGLNQDDELADHLVSILRYMRVLQDEEEFRELTQYAILPALDKVLAASRMRDENDQSALPLYLAVLQALYDVLVTTVGEPLIKAANWEEEHAQTQSAAMQEIQLVYDADEWS
jgi:nitrate reductase assembly molybdenum cofactor insertion protein NarJ